MGWEQKSGGAALDTITIVRKSILDLDVECIVNAANEYLQAGSRVCGAIFAAAGRTELQAACDAIGHCTTGEAVITPGFRLKAGFVIHTPGPVWQGGRAREKELLYSCYQSALALAMLHGIHTIAFPLISAGIFGMPVETAWQVALESCRDFLEKHPDADLHVTFAVLDPVIEKKGKECLSALAGSHAER